MLPASRADACVTIESGSGRSAPNGMTAMRGVARLALGAVGEALRRPASDAVDEAVNGAVDEAVNGAVDEAVNAALGVVAVKARVSVALSSSEMTSTRRARA